DEILMPDIAFGTKQVDRFQYVVEVVGGFAHAHENHFLHRAKPPCQYHLSKDLHAGNLPEQTALACHAETAANGAAHLGGDAEPIAWQQHTFHHLPVSQFDQQA